MATFVMSGQLKPGDHCPGCLFIVNEERDANGQEVYRVRLISPYSGEIVVEPAEPLSSGAVFQWLNDHRDW